MLLRVWFSVVFLLGCVVSPAQGGCPANVGLGPSGRRLPCPDTLRLPPLVRRSRRCCPATDHLARFPPRCRWIVNSNGQLNLNYPPQQYIRCLNARTCALLCPV